MLHGTLTVASAGGAAVLGSGTGTVTLTGTRTQINTTLAAANNIVYRGANGYFGTDTLTVVTNDGGNTGGGGVNPLDHYNTFGWREGRDPSTGFDTSSYLAANPDVAAGDVNPLAHYLHFGIHEGRSPFAEGIWG